MNKWSEISDLAIANLPALLAEMYPNGGIKNGEYVVGDIHGAPGQSLSINMNTGLWIDFANEDHKGNIFGLWAARYGTSRRGAMLEISERLGKPFDDSTLKNAASVSRRKKRDDGWEPVSIQCWSAWPPLPAEKRPPHASYVYIVDGVYYGTILRWNEPGGKKDIRPRTPCEKGGQIEMRPKHMKAPRPLYMPDGRLCGNRVVVVEGEKAANALHDRMPHEVVTWPGGSSAVNLANWELLRGKDVIVWPDNDAPGKKAAKQIEKKLDGVAASVVTLDVSSLGEGEDAADLEKPEEFC